MVNRHQITTVVDPAAGDGLVGLDVVKDELNIASGDTSKDAKLTRYIAEVSIAAQQFCNRVFAVETIKDEFWPARGEVPSMFISGEDPLQLSRWPVVSIVSVIENGVALTDSVDYRVDKENGALFRLDSAGDPKIWPAYATAVTFQAGFDPMPADITGKIVRMVTARYYAAGRDPSLMSESIPGVRDYRVWVPTGSDAGNMPPDVADVLNNYRVPVVR